jgi:hypothetical protein
MTGRLQPGVDDGLTVLDSRHFARRPSGWIGSSGVGSGFAISRLTRGQS